MKFKMKQIAVLLKKINAFSTIIWCSLSHFTHSKEDSIYTQTDKKKIIAFWNTPGRYFCTCSQKLVEKGPWQLRITPEGSSWLWRYNKARNKHGPPTKCLKEKNGKYKAWDEWVEKKMKYDRWQALFTAYHANSHFIPPSRSHERTRMEYKPPEHPGPIPEDLFLATGNPPNFALAITPMVHEIRFDDKWKTQLQETTHFKMERFAYYRFSHGICSPGNKLSNYLSSDLSKLFKKANINDSEKRILLSVASLEGGFDTINTYDTGFVSIGFMQFASMREGNGSLAYLLQNFKEWYPKEYHLQFKRYGIDILSDNTICVVDPSTGALLKGADAVQKIIDDKRLTAVFQHAASVCEPFKITQIKTALLHNTPNEKKITVQWKNKKNVQLKISDIFTTEAGKATVMDRYVNTGNISKVSTVIQNIITKYRINNLKKLRTYELELIKLCKYRKDFLQDETLSSPLRKKQTNSNNSEKKDDTRSLSSNIASNSSENRTLTIQKEKTPLEKERIEEGLELTKSKKESSSKKTNNNNEEEKNSNSSTKEYTKITPSETKSPKEKKPKTIDL